MKPSWWEIFYGNLNNVKQKQKKWFQFSWISTKKDKILQIYIKGILFYLKSQDLFPLRFYFRCYLIYGFLVSVCSGEEVVAEWEL